jgi:hypothetical protein
MTLGWPSKPLTTPWGGCQGLSTFPQKLLGKRRLGTVLPEEKLLTLAPRPSMNFQVLRFYPIILFLFFYVSLRTYACVS